MDTKDELQLPSVALGGVNLTPQSQGQKRARMDWAGGNPSAIAGLLAGGGERGYAPLSPHHRHARYRQNHVGDGPPPGIRNQPLYIFQCTSDTRPEDLLITPVLSEQGKISYHASPVVTAMITGGICILDEGNRMNEKSWASLAPLLDHRRYVESIIAGIQIPAHKEFRCCVTMNQDESTFEIPDYILSRLQPTLSLGMPTEQDELAILKYPPALCQPRHGRNDRAVLAKIASNGSGFFTTRWPSYIAIRGQAAVAGP